MAKNINGFFPGDLSPSATVGGCIDIYESVWPNSGQTIERVEAECAGAESGIRWELAPTIGAGVHQNMRTNRMLPVSYLADVENNTLMQNVHNQFNMLLLAASTGYSERFGVEDGQQLVQEDYSLLRYSGGQQYHAHHDGVPSNARVISAICYLNDDFVGGELEFPNFDIKIKPQAGMLILFPSNYAYQHIAHPVTDGSKYALVTWIKAHAI
jgi:hypothetical protein|tara:strand:- start:4971 stop:5606 length:636 start_codon:yes stop_codon:yes gene_type:complete